MEVPRIALLSWCSPMSRFAGGAALRRLLSCLPRENVLWVGFHEGSTGSNLPTYHAVPPRPIHWRLSGSVIEHLDVDVVQARSIAARMWKRLEPFEPQVLWVFPEMWAISVGEALQKRSGLPMHATVHDAPETAGYGAIPRLYLPSYLRHMRRFLRATQSIDAVSKGLVDHLRLHFGFAPERTALVIPPCLETELLWTIPERTWRSRPERRIGLCGSMRISAGQWQQFLHALGALPYPIVLESFTALDELPAAALPPNVRISARGYRNTEAELVMALSACDLDAAYLGVWKEPDRQLFGRTSLSSKLTTYAAAGLPVLVDATEDSVAWQLVDRYRAGVRLGDTPEAATAALRMLFDQAPVWTEAAAGARHLCTGAFDLDHHATVLRDQLCRIAAR